MLRAGTPLPSSGKPDTVSPCPSPLQVSSGKPGTGVCHVFALKGTALPLHDYLRSVGSGCVCPASLLCSSANDVMPSSLSSVEPLMHGLAHVCGSPGHGTTALRWEMSVLLPRVTLWPPKILKLKRQQLCLLCLWDHGQYPQKCLHTVCSHVYLWGDNTYVLSHDI